MANKRRNLKSESIEKVKRVQVQAQEFHRRSC